MPKNINQLIKIKASPQEVYEALTDEAKHAAFTGEPAKIQATMGGAFSAYDGYITGTLTELVPNKLIVLQWNDDRFRSQGRRSAVDERVKQGLYSTATFMIDPEDGGTRLRFFQQGIPEDLYDELSAGWQEHYWDKLKAALEK